MSYFDQFQQALSNIQSEMLPIVKGISVPCRVLGVIGALFYISYRVWRDWADAAPIDMLGLLRPFILILCISFFPLVVSFINGVLDPIATSTSGLYTEQVRKNKQIHFHIEKARIQQENKAIAQLVGKEEKKQSFWISLKDLGKTMADAVSQAIYQLLLGIVQFLTDLILHVAVFLISFVRSMLLVILATVGPIAFALAIWPGLEGGVASWITRYISISLWLPVMNLISFLIEKMNGIMFSKWEHRFETGSFNTTSGNIDLDMYMYLILKIITVVAYLAVPTISSWIVQSGGGGAITRRLTGLGQAAATSQMAKTGYMKAIKGTVGGVSTAGSALAASIGKKAITPK